MSLNRLFRPALVAALGLGVSSASANVEVGGTAGVHVFSETNELGVNDVAGAPSERNSALFGARVGVFFGDMIGVEGEFGIVPSEARQQVFDVWNVTYRAHIVAQFRAKDENAKVIPFVFLGGGGMSIVKSDGENVGINSIQKDTDAALYIGVGAKYRVENGWGLRVDGRILFPPASNEDAEDPMAKGSDGFTTDFELLLSIYKEFGRKVPKKETPPPPVDDDPDKDGIRGEADKCPTEAEDKDGFEDDNGCPDNDNDNDGIADATDQCKMEPEDKDGFEDENGCPDLDNDKDGIADDKDACKDQPEDKDSFKDEDGCPDPDNDEDGVLDAADKCPDQKETKNGYQDDDGCPDEIPDKVKKFTGTIQGINFKVGDATLLPTSNATLDKAVAVLKEFGDLKMEIQGHTDDQPLKAKPGAPFQDNQALSQGRAETVMKYFTSKGIDPSRLTAKGYGDSQPAVPPTGLTGAKLNDARTKNRRVEFKLISPLDAAGGAAPPPPPPPAPNP
jgi:outer membrane protein OmpA-like peptidoglycan-associated protein